MELRPTLVIKGLTLEEIKETLVKIREIEQRHPEGTIFAFLEGTEDLSEEETIRIIKEIFPKSPTSG